jgi:hypothetical protein
MLRLNKKNSPGKILTVNGIQMLFSNPLPILIKYITIIIIINIIITTANHRQST